MYQKSDLDQCVGRWPSLGGGAQGGGPGDGGTVETRRDVPGLSTAHIRPQPGEVEIYEGGSLLVARKERFKLHQVGGGLRGRISGFSKSSRKRLMRKIAMLKRDSLPLFVTLTYPGEWSVDGHTWKRDFNAFVRRLKRRWPQMSLIWKLEFQKRGAPHFHLLVWGVEYIDMICFTAHAWYEVVASGDERHLAAGTQVARVRSWRGVSAYASKYLGKVQETANIEYTNLGRFWGVVGADYLPWAVLRREAATNPEIYQLMRYMRRYAGVRGRDYPSLTIFCNAPEQWGRLFSIF